MKGSATEMSKRELGVIIARFQAPTLTQAHQYLLSQVATRVNRVLILLGSAPVPALRKNPLEVGIRMRMVQDWWATQYPTGPEAIILPLLDSPSNEEWAIRVDQTIAAININGEARLFCGPDGAGPTYAEAGGRWPIEVLDSMGGHASKVRESMIPRHTEDFRAGIIYGIERRFNNPIMVVDVIIRDGSRVLLGHKHIDRRQDGREWRLVGGFVDPTDATLELAAKREVSEETGLEVSSPMYLGSRQVADWRYRSGPEIILSAVFTCERIFGEPRVNDDLDALRWFEMAEAAAIVHPIHSELFALAATVQ